MEYLLLGRLGEDVAPSAAGTGKNCNEFCLPHGSPAAPSITILHLWNWTVVGWRETRLYSVFCCPLR